MSMDEKKVDDVATISHGDDDNFDFPVNLVQKSKEHIAFLQSLHSQGVTLQRPSPKSLQRYRDIWLPLVHAHPHQQLVPPADCAWLWHCHRLAPFRYASYLKSQFRADCQILEANPPFTFQLGDEEVCYGAGEESYMKVLAETTRTLWNRLHPQEPFFLQEATASEDSTEEEKSDSLLLGGFDLLGSTDRQATFLWQVSDPSFSDDAFLLEGHHQYYMFLKLRKQAKKTKVVLVPTYQIDLMWHTHILSNLTRYFMDCKSIIGSTLNHDDSLNDRTEDGPLDRAFKDTKALWKESYGEDYFAHGGMYRGEPPKAYYSTSWNASNENDWQYPPLGPFLHLIGLQGASSTNPTGGAYDLEVVWTWKETSSQISRHPTGSIVGDPADCWIKYDASANSTLEDAFQGQGGEGGCDLGNGYKVDFHAMNQTKTSTGYKREVQRHINIVSAIDMPKVWCWKETASQMSNHSPSSMYGGPAICWIKYDDVANAKLESSFQAQGQNGEMSPSSGYMVDFMTMKQTKTSTGFQRDVQRVDAVEDSSGYTTHATSTSTAYWTPITGTAPDGSPGFVAMNPKSTTARINANPYKANYIFGKTGSQIGYYHITTKEAYCILAIRIGIRSSNLKERIAVCSCCTLGLCNSSQWMKDMEAELEDLEGLKAIATARALVSAPTGMVGLSPKIQNDTQKRSKHYSDSGAWYFPTMYYDAAGGCGAGVLHGGVGGTSSGSSTYAGGGCGAAACGAAACGGGGCGGGGCGGGGCGGGGCGGG